MNSLTVSCTRKERFVIWITKEPPNWRNLTTSILHPFLVKLSFSSASASASSSSSSSLLLLCICTKTEDQKLERMFSCCCCCCCWVRWQVVVADMNLSLQGNQFGKCCWVFNSYISLIYGYIQYIINHYHLLLSFTLNLFLDVLASSITNFLIHGFNVWPNLNSFFLFDRMRWWVIVWRERRRREGFL